MMDLRVSSIIQMRVKSEEERGFCCIQPCGPKDQGPKVRQIKERQIINPDFLYLDSTSSFSQVFTEKHLKAVNESEVILKASCNAGTTYAHEKGWIVDHKGEDLFWMWLVRNGIGNLLSLPWLKKNGFIVTYDSRTCWKIHCPDGTVLTLKEDTGLCEGFPLS